MLWWSVYVVWPSGVHGQPCVLFMIMHKQYLPPTLVCHAATQNVTCFILPFIDIGKLVFLDMVKLEWKSIIIMSKIRNRKSKNPGRFDLEGLCQPRRPLLSRRSPRLTKTFEAKTSRVFTLPVAYFAHIIDFHSYVDATMSLYSIMVKLANLVFTFQHTHQHTVNMVNYQ